MDTLGNLVAGERGSVVGFLDSGTVYRRKLMAMGLTIGTSFRVCRVAPLGDPIQLEVRGSQLTLRRHEADIVEVSKI